MVGKREMDGSRRNIMRATIGAVWAGLLSRIARAEAAKKMTPGQAEYQDTPRDIYSCAVCTLFEPPKSCKVAEGDVSKDGWCKAFALAD